MEVIMLILILSSMHCFARPSMPYRACPSKFHVSSPNKLQCGQFLMLNGVKSYASSYSCLSVARGLFAVFALKWNDPTPILVDSLIYLSQLLTMTDRFSQIQTGCIFNITQSWMLKR